jgi:hypothetical protein
MAGRFEGLSEIEWKLFSNLFPVPGKGGKENLQPTPDAFSTRGCIFYSPVAAGVICPRGPYGSPEVPLIAGFNAGTRIESWLYFRLGF